MPSELRSSSTSGQCTPKPPPAMRQFLRCSGVACRSLDLLRQVQCLGISFRAGARDKDTPTAEDSREPWRPAAGVVRWQNPRRTSPPALSRSGYLLEQDGLWLLQKSGWISVSLGDVTHFKQPSLATVQLRLTDGRKKILDLSHLSTSGLSRIVSALKSAAHKHRVASTSRP